MAKWIVEISEAEINTAHWFSRLKLKMIFASSRKAVRVSTLDLDKEEDGFPSCSVNGKPVKLYAVEDHQ